MRYMLMLYADEKAGAAIPPDRMEKAMETMFAYQAALEKAGAFVMTAPLARTPDARTLRMEGGRPSFDGKAFTNPDGELKVHDGPYAETREQFGGYFFVDVPSLEEAVAWARRCPSSRFGTIEVRPVHEPRPGN